MKDPRTISDDRLSNLSMLELFRVETENQTAALTASLLDLERIQAAPGADAEASAASAELLETLMRAAHSLKGAARIVNLSVAVRIAHAMEDCFVAAQKGQVQLRQREIDVLFRGVDLLQHISKCTEGNLGAWESEHAAEVSKLLDALVQIIPGRSADPNSSRIPQDSPHPQFSLERSPAESAPPATKSVSALENLPPERVLRLTAETLNRLLGLAGESLVESRWLRPFSDSMQRLKRRQTDLAQTIEDLRKTLEKDSLSERANGHLVDAFAKVNECQQFLSDRLQELDLFDRRSAHLSHRLYLEVLRARMRPFGDGVRHFPRMVRDMARALGKEVKFEIIGEATQVDRDILERLETPLGHLLRNAVDHGCETATERERAGKSPQNTILLEARHSAGMLQVTVSDDGSGISLERLRRLIVEQKLIPAAAAEKLVENELLEFLFLPGFTMRDTVTEISGRGVGLDIVRDMVRSVRGNVRVSTQAGQGTRFQLQLPLTLSVLRTLLVQIGGEPYAIPLAQIVRTVRLARERIEVLQGRHHFAFGGQQIGLVSAHQILDCGDPRPLMPELLVVILGDRNTRYGLVVDELLGERELVVQPLDPRLGKVKDISAAALMEDGSPVLILDVDDLLCSIERLVSQGSVAGVNSDVLAETFTRPKRILAVDDSLTVRELERKLLTSRGYVADVAVDGLDGWNAVRSGNYDLIITDVDMPRMDGIELTSLIRKDPKLKSLPVMLVSYKDREEDRLRGLDAGANYYLTKGSFQDETLLQAVADLIGEPEL